MGKGQKVGPTNQADIILSRASSETNALCILLGQYFIQSQISSSVENEMEKKNPLKLIIQTLSSQGDSCDH